MIKEYLEKQKRILSEKREELEETLADISNRIRETEKFKELIRTENEPPFSEFSPHTVSTRAEEKIAELDETLNELENTCSETKAKLEALELSEMELAAALSETEEILKKTETTKIEPENSASTAKPQNSEPDQEITMNAPLSDKDSVISSLNKIKNVSISDPYLAQSMIAELIAKLSD